MVRLAGLEPAKGVFASLLIIAFCCANLLIDIQGFHWYYKGKGATMSKYRQKKLCQSVSEFLAVSEVCQKINGRILCQSVSARCIQNAARAKCA